MARWECSFKSWAKSEPKAPAPSIYTLTGSVNLGMDVIKNIGGLLNLVQMGNFFAPLQFVVEEVGIHNKRLTRYTQNMLIVGLTGGIACGKSTVSHELKTKYHYTVIDADLIAREVVLPGKPAYNKIVRSFDDVHDLLHEDGTLNRTVLGQVVFQNKRKLKDLNSIVHPAVQWEIVRQILRAYISCKSLVILDVPLLFESQLHLICGLIVTVSTKSELQIERLLARNAELSREDAENRIKNQMTNEERNYRSDIVIDNSGSVSDLKKSVDTLSREIKPSIVWTILDLIPPFGVVSALFTFTIKRITEKYKGNKPKNQ